MLRRIGPLIALATLMPGCVSEPPLTEAGALPITIAGIGSDRVGAFALDRMPTRTWAALQAAAPFESSDWRGSHVIVKFAKGTAIADLHYVTSSQISRDNYGDAELLFVVVNFGAWSNATPQELTATNESRLKELARIGLASNRIVGVDLQRHLYTATDSDNWLLRWQDGLVVAAVRRVAKQPLTELIGIHDLASMRAMTSPQQQDQLQQLLIPAIQPSIPSPWYAEVASLSEDYYARRMKPHKGAMLRIANRMAIAGVRKRLPLLEQVFQLAIKLRDGDGNLIPPAAAWYKLHTDRFLTDLDRHLGKDGARRTVKSQRARAQRLLAAGTFATWTWNKAKDEFRYLNGHLGFTLDYLAVRDQEPFLQIAKRLRWGYRTKFPRLLRSKDYWQDECQVLAELARSRTLDSFGTRMADYYGGLGQLGSLGSWPGLAGGLEVVAAMRSYLNSPPNDSTGECQRLEAVAKRTIHMSRPIQVIWRESLLQRLQGLMEATHDPANRATIQALHLTLDRALAASRKTPTNISLATEINKVLKAPSGLLQAARSLRLQSSILAQQDALAAISNRTAQLGPAAEVLAQLLSLKPGRTLAKQAAAEAKQGHSAMAALIYLRAATLGSRNGPSAISSWQARHDLRGLAGTDSTNGVRKERSEWLTRARNLALEATVAVLPATDRNDPVYDLQDRYIRGQLAGSLRLPEVFGVRLAGLADMTRHQAGAQRLQLTTVADASPGSRVQWRLPRAGAIPVDLGKYQIDSSGWTRLRTMRRELDQAAANLEAARSSEGSSKQDLQSRDQELTAKAETLRALIENRNVDPSAAQNEIDRLKQRSSALRSAVGNYNRKQAHINEMVNAYNKQVQPHNKLLERLLAQLATAYKELLRPATEAYTERAIAALETSSDEKSARRWLLGLLDAPGLTAQLAPPHPEAIAHKVRDVSDPAVAAKALLDAVRQRSADKRLWQGVPFYEHLNVLKPAFEAYGSQYGADDLVARVLGGSRVIGKEHHKLVASYFDTKRKQQILKLLGLDK